MPIINNPFNGKLNLDVAQYRISNGDYIDALNITKDSEGVGNDLVVANILGNTEIPYTLPAGENKVIGFSGIASNKMFSILATNKIINHDCIEKTQCLPLYRYLENGEKKENITNWALSLFQSNYKDEKISKEDIFEYVYAVLHNPTYRQKYEMDLKRDFPRIPFYQNFWQYAEAGKELMHLHLNYETLPTTEYAKVTRLPLESLLPKRKKSVW